MSDCEKIEPPKDAYGKPIYVGDVLRKMFNGEDTDIVVVVKGVSRDTIFVKYGEDEEDYEKALAMMTTIPYYEVASTCFRHMCPCLEYTLSEFAADLYSHSEHFDEEYTARKAREYANRIIREEGDLT